MAKDLIRRDLFLKNQAPNPKLCSMVGYTYSYILVYYDSSLIFVIDILMTI